VHPNDGKFYCCNYFQHPTKISQSVYEKFSRADIEQKANLKIPEAHQSFIEATLDKWLQLGIVKQTNSLYNSPLFCVPKKQGQGLRIED